MFGLLVPKGKKVNRNTWLRLQGRRGQRNKMGLRVRRFGCFGFMALEF